MSPAYTWRREQYLLVAYALSAVVLITSSIFYRVDHQDSWTLEGLLPQTLLFILAFVAYSVNVQKNSRLVIIVSAFVVILSAVPHIKYLQVLGTYDSIAHMGYANKVVLLGHVPTSGFYSKEYSGTPGMHIFLASLSLVTGFSMTETIKVLSLTLSFLTPFITYYFIRRVFNKKFNKFILFSLCITLPIYQSIVGTSFALPLFFIFISTLLSQYITARRTAYITILFVTSSAIIISHGVTSLFLSVLLCSIFVFKALRSRLFKREQTSSSSPRITFYIAFLITAAVLLWWFFNAQYLIRTLLSSIISDFFSSGSITQIIPSKFFEITLTEQITLLYTRFFDTFIVGILSLLGIIFYFKNRKDFSVYGYVHILIEHVIIITICIALISAPFVFILKSYTLERFYGYFKPISPILIGLSLMTCFLYMKRKLNTSFVNIRVISAILLVALIVPNIFTVFIYQPMLPKENNEYVVDYRSVNTIYQSTMISFAEDHYVKGLKMGSDSVTSWQMAGFTSTAFFSGYLYLDPLIEDYSRANMLLLHYSGIAGPLNERLEYRTKEKLNDIKIKLGNNIIYDNGESFIILTKLK